MNIFQQTLLDLERTQQVLKKQLRVFFISIFKITKIYIYYRYEEEISRLRLQLDQMQHGGYNSVPQPDSMKQQQQPQLPPPPPPPQQQQQQAPPPLLSSGSPLVNVPHFGPPPVQQQQQQAVNNNVRSLNKQPMPPQPTNPIGLTDLDPESVPANMKVEGQDWFAL